MTDGQVIALNMVTLRGGVDAARVETNLDYAADAGFDGVGLWVDTIRGWLGVGRDIDDLGRAVEQRNLAIDEICFVAVLDDDGAVADQTRVFQWAKQLGCPRVVCLYPRPENPLEKVRDDWAGFVGKIEHLGVCPAFEFIGPWENYNSPLAAWDVIRAGPGIGSMVFDTFHFWRGGGDLGQLESFPLDRISHVHLNDVKDAPREKAGDADRTYPGEGVIPLVDILRKLSANGFSGPLSVEIFGEVQKQDPGEVARRAYHSAAKTLARVESPGPG
jgi:2-keto-myo-inositol isomerase